MSNNKQQPKDAEPQGDENQRQIAAILGQIIQAMPIADHLDRLRQRREVMSSPDVLANVKMRERAREIAEKLPQPGDDDGPQWEESDRLGQS
jgi:hypothetical protein